MTELLVQRTELGDGTFIGPIRVNGREQPPPSPTEGKHILVTGVQNAEPLQEGTIDLLALYERVEYMERTAGATNVVFLEKK